MRKTVSLVLAICGTLLLLLLFATGRLIYTHVYSQDFSDIAETGPQSTITLTENDVKYRKPTITRKPPSYSCSVSRPTPPIRTLSSPARTS